MNKSERIKAEEKRLRKSYKNISKDKLTVVDGLIIRASHMRIHLEDFEEDLNTTGWVEEFSQSEKTPPYERERPAARLYNQLNKNYQCIIKQLSDLLPKETQKIESDGFEEFCESK